MVWLFGRLSSCDCLAAWNPNKLHSLPFCCMQSHNMGSLPFCCVQSHNMGSLPFYCMQFHNIGSLPHVSVSGWNIVWVLSNLKNGEVSAAGELHETLGGWGGVKVRRGSRNNATFAFSDIQILPIYHYYIGYVPVVMVVLLPPWSHQIMLVSDLYSQPFHHLRSWTCDMQCHAATQYLSGQHVTCNAMRHRS